MAIMEVSCSVEAAVDDVARLQLQVEAAPHFFIHGWMDGIILC